MTGIDSSAGSHSPRLPNSAPDVFDGLPSSADARSALSWAVALLADADVDTPRLDAELLLCHVWVCNRAHLYAHPEDPLSRIESSHFGRLVERRAEREPLAYLTGRKEFFGLDFLVDRRVLVPRPETELLVELAIARLRGMLPTNPTPAVADVGTGCAAIAVSLATQIPTAIVHALDVSDEALEVARLNCERHGVAERIELLQGDLLAALEERVDLILANLPYIARPALAVLPPEIARYEPRVALDGGTDGLNAIRRILEQAEAHLNPEGSILLEIGAEQGPTSRALATRFFPTARMEVHPDYAGHDRVLEINTAANIGG